MGFIFHFETWINDWEKRVNIFCLSRFLPIHISIYLKEENSLIPRLIRFVKKGQKLYLEDYLHPHLSSFS